MTEDKPKVAISVEMQCSLRYCVSITDKYRAEEPRYLWYCGTKKYCKGDGTGTVEKWYRGAAVVLWYRATLLHWLSILKFTRLRAVSRRQHGSC